MSRKVSNILLTGPPGCGKTTVIMKVVNGLKYPAKGFYTEEVRGINGRRIGFDVVMLDGRRGPLARVGSSGRRVGKYTVDLDFLEEYTLPEIAGDPGGLVVLDEIGKMECLSVAFQRAVRTLLDRQTAVLGTVATKGGAFIMEVRSRRDVELVEIMLNNRENLAKELVKRFEV